LRRVGASGDRHFLWCGSSAPSERDASSLDEATQQLAQGLQQDNPGMKISGQMKNVI